jgi:hypothetical protein
VQKTGWNINRLNPEFYGATAGSSEVKYDNPFTAADEKIALSMVPVNNKPQYLVFCLHLQYPPHKWLNLPVESANRRSGSADGAHRLPQIQCRSGCKTSLSLQPQA